MKFVNPKSLSRRAQEIKIAASSPRLLLRNAKEKIPKVAKNTTKKKMGIGGILMPIISRFLKGFTSITSGKSISENTIPRVRYL